MSYSFQLRAATKTALIDAVAAKMDEIVGQQACHTIDRAQAIAAATSFVQLLPDDASQDVSITMSGYVAGEWAQNELSRLTGASVNVNCGLARREA